MYRCSFCGNNLKELNNNIMTCNSRTCTIFKFKLKKKIITNHVLDNFVKFWEIWPKKTSKLDAIKAWLTLEPDTDLARLIIKSVIEHKAKSQQWETKQYIPYPATFIRGRMWENEIIEKEKEKAFNQPVEYKPAPKPELTPELIAAKEQAFADIKRILHRKHSKNAQDAPGMTQTGSNVS